MSAEVSQKALEGFLSTIRFNDAGLVPAIVQESRSGEVLMLAWMNEEAVRLTIAEQRTVFWSRSRAELWRKGETSSNVQKLVSIAQDCDGDTVLLRVEQHGPACHTGSTTCFTGREFSEELGGEAK